MEFLQDHPWLLALVIFLARITDVSMATVRTITVFRGHRALAAGIGFLEVLVWIVAAGQVLRNLDQWYLALAYAAGFATGNYVGIWFEAKLAMGSELVRAVSESRDIALAERLRGDYSVIEVAGKHEGAPVEVLLIVERRRNVPALLRTIYETDPDAICTMSDVRRPEAPGPVRQRKRRPPFGPRGASKRK